MPVGKVRAGDRVELVATPGCPEIARLVLLDEDANERVPGELSLLGRGWANREIETGARDQFYVYPKDLYRDMLVNYSAERASRDATAQMALLLCEHEGVPIAASTIAISGCLAA